MEKPKNLYAWPPWLGLFLGTLFFLLLYQMGFFFSHFLFLIFHCCTKVPLISEYWPCYLLLCWIHLLSQVVFFGGVYRVFFVHYYVICKQWQFYFLLSNLDAFISSFLIAVAKTSNTMLNRSGESGYPCLLPDLSVKALIFAHWVCCWL